MGEINSWFQKGILKQNHFVKCNIISSFPYITHTVAKYYQQFSPIMPAQ